MSETNYFIPRLSCVTENDDKVVLCAFRTDDEAILAYANWMNEESIGPWIRKNTVSISFEEEKKWVFDKINDKNSIMFNIAIHDTRMRLWGGDDRTSAYELVGNCEIIRSERNCTLGICIGDEFGRDRGIGTAVIKRLIDYCFNELNAHRVCLRAVSDNVRAIRCYEKAGFKITGVEREVVWYDGHWADIVCLDILDREYKEIKNREKEDISINFKENEYAELCEEAKKKGLSAEEYAEQKLKIAAFNGSLRKSANRFAEKIDNIDVDDVDEIDFE